MKAEDLRIGNWVKVNSLYEHLFKDGYFQVNGIDKKYIFAFTNNAFNYHEVTPIPLTSEILEKAGLRKWSNKVFGFETEPYTLVNHRLCFRLKDGVINQTIIHNGQPNLGLVIDNIQSVNQLQNLFYALCGEELNVKL